MQSARRPKHQHPLLRLLWIAIGVSVGISLALALSAPPVSPLFLASLGGSAVFLFGLTQAPAVQPRALFGGHLGSAILGIACFQFFGDALWVYALAQTLALLTMLATRTVHPPAGANAILMVYSHASWAALLQTVLVGIAALALVAAIWSRLYPGLVRYPLAWKQPSPPSMFWGGWGD